jgi:hypothetical protein
MIRLGIVDCDTSHVVAFTQRLNHLDIAEDQWVDGATIVAAVPLPSLVSPERVGPFTEQLKGYGVEILDSPAALLGKVDGVLIESVDGSVHGNERCRSSRPAYRYGWTSRSPAARPRRVS